MIAERLTRLSDALKIDIIDTRMTSYLMKIDVLMPYFISVKIKESILMNM